MATAIFSRCVLVLFLVGSTTVHTDDIDDEMDQQMMMKIVREAVNQTQADTLNLPSNATTIRENITDTFSCDGLPYGYYADVDNECQIFHVCLPTKAASGRNTTYRWSFICPQETVFNQEVLVCTRQRDAIDCEDSPMYYDKNLDIGKISNDTEAENNDKSQNDINMNTNEVKEPIKHNPIKQKHNNKKIPVLKRKQNIVFDNKFRNEGIITDKEKINKEDNEYEFINMNEGSLIESEDDARITSERSLKSKPIRKRGLFRFAADAI